MPLVAYSWLADESLVCSWWCVFVNSLIHTLMYSYYIACSLGYDLNAIKKFVTLAQIIQFFSGFFLVQAWFFIRNTHGCAKGIYSSILSHSVNSSFIVMFCLFFFRSYPKKKKEDKNNEEKVADQKTDDKKKESKKEN
jgi:hypothetical protein